MKSEDFDIEFIERTQKLIREYSGDVEFTLLINCLLGLIILPNEFSKKQNLKYLEKNLSEISEIYSLLNESDDFLFNPTYWDNKRRVSVKTKQTLGCFLRKIRNAFAHIHSITPLNENGKWIGIKINDLNKKTKNVELRLTLKYEHILCISRFISDEYQRERLEL